MFTIKNVRGTTVAKASNLPSVLPQQHKPIQTLKSPPTDLIKKEETQRNSHMRKIPSRNIQARKQ